MRGPCRRDIVVPPGNCTRSGFSTRRAKRLVDHRLHMPLVDHRQSIELGNTLRVHLHPPQRRLTVAPCIFGAECADQLLHAGIDVGAIEGENASLAGGNEIGDGFLPFDGAMAAGERRAADDGVTRSRD